jgi:hypothetical protein
VLVATGLEALVHVDEYGSTRQFKGRVSQLATELGVTGLGISEAKKAYERRSSLAHGQQLGQLSGPDRELYQSMETTLRLAILRAIEDDAFASPTLRETRVQPWRRSSHFKVPVCHSTARIFHVESPRAGKTDWANCRWPPSFMRDAWCGSLPASTMRSYCPHAAAHQTLIVSMP